MDMEEEFEGLEDLFSIPKKELMESFLIPSNVGSEKRMVDMEEVFEGIEDLFSVPERELMETFLISSNVGNEKRMVDPFLDNNVVVSANLQKQVSNDDTEMVDHFLDEDLDEVLENFLKRSQESEQISHEMICQKDDEALTVATLFDLEQSLVVHDGQNLVVVDEKKEVHQDEDSCPKKKLDVDVEMHEAVPGSSDASCSGGVSRNFVGNNNQYHNYSKCTLPSRLTYLTTPQGVLEPVPYFSSSSSSPPSYDETRPNILLGGIVDISFLLDNTPSSWRNRQHARSLGQPSYSSSSSTSPTSMWNNLGKGDSPFGCATIPQQPWPQTGVGLSQPTPCFDNFTSPSCNNSLSKGSSCNLEPAQRWKRKEREIKLPPGWEVVTRVRKNGKSKGQVDKYYYNRETNQTCRSLKELYRLLNLPPYGLEASTPES